MKCIYCGRKLRTITFIQGNKNFQGRGLQMRKPVNTTYCKHIQTKNIRKNISYSYRVVLKLYDVLDTTYDMITKSMGCARCGYVVNSNIKNKNQKINYNKRIK